MSSAAYDLLIQNCLLVDANNSLLADVAIQGEKIAALASAGQLPAAAARVIDARGLYLFPGLIDPHVHINSRIGGTMRSGFQWTSRAAAHGGTTTFFDFTAPVEGSKLLSSLEDQKAEGEGAVHSDFCLHAGIPAMRPEDLWQVREAIERGFPSFKAFMLPSKGRPEIDDGLLFALLTACREQGGLMGVHAENGRLIAYLSERLIKEDKTGIRYFAQSRPNICEAEAVGRAIMLAEAAGSALYVYHVSSAEGTQLIRQARKRGVPIYGETCPHYLLFTGQVYESENGFLFNRVPPIRSQRDQDALWEAVADGTLSCIGTDDVATNLTYKRQPPSGRDFIDLPGGMPQIETRLLLTYSEGVLKKRISLNRLVYLLSTGPARLFGLYPRKGTIAVGSDADLVLFDPNLERTITAGELHGGSDYTIYEGWKVKGWPVMTLVRGRVVVEQERLLKSDALGQCCPRKIDPVILKEASA